ncbi:uncharacterized protein LOC120556534 [Perca fluviatilis]|uniref:uncharacterized protein LOC120556534 n=1 Tax=Perca fluviatilis TaxID=8168 RepID=UPI0019664489|nr:uncharacterized protein LOC120556534 [Perca fluviatilis]
MTKFIKKLRSRFMTPAALRGEVHDIPYKDPLRKTQCGFHHQSTLNRLLEAGEVTPQKAQQFQQAALAFLVGAVEYAMDKLPLKDALLKHARFIDVQLRAECGLEDGPYFVDRFQELLPFHDPKEQHQVSEEFMEYQVMDIPMPQDPTVFDVDVEFWGRVSSTKNKVTGLNQFRRLSKIAALVLVLPHSNADAEMVGLNKTSTRNSLSLDGTLSSIMTLKMAGLEPNCFKWEPTPQMIKESKKDSSQRTAAVAAGDDAAATPTAAPTTANAAPTTANAAPTPANAAPTTANAAPTPANAAAAGGDVSPMEVDPPETIHSQDSSQRTAAVAAGDDAAATPTAAPTPANAAPPTANSATAGGDGDVSPMEVDPPEPIHSQDQDQGDPMDWE